MEFLPELNWIAVGQIMLIDILLGGDNAIVIALACRNLPQQLRMRAILWGTFGAIVIRVVLLFFAVQLLELTLIKLIGGVLLFWIGLKLLADHAGHGEVASSDKLLTAIKTIVVADMVMSLDNVLAIASAASHAGAHQFVLAVFGILLSIPVIVWGSTLILKLMARFPQIVLFGAGLLGYLAGSMIVADKVFAPWLQAHVAPGALTIAGLNLPGLVGATAVVLLGSWIRSRQKA